MIATFLFTLVIVSLSVAGLGLSSLLGRGPLRGGCGGVRCRGCGECPETESESERTP